MSHLREQLWPVFLAEVGEHIAELEALLDVSGQQIGAVDIHALFRYFHTIKSSGSMLDFQSMEQLAHASEDMLFVLRDSGLALEVESLRLLTRAVRGTPARTTASIASLVPGTDASTRALGWERGIRLKSSGRLVVANVHGPAKSGAENHRPATRK